MIKPIAIYLPQFHPIPENDKAWGEGFTEWTNVKKAKPLFEGHYQPHVPHEDVGYYDLRDPEVMVRQAAMAKEYGIYGFAFYHYWFNGKRLLETPLDNMLKSGKPDFPFLYIWANENWTKRWDGEDNEIIIKQDYSHEDDFNHINFLCNNIFSDKRYITINEKPVIAIYKPFLLPNVKKTIQIWREVVSKTKFKEIYIITVDNFLLGENPLELGFDATFHFQPDFRNFQNKLRDKKLNRILDRIGLKKSPFKNNSIYDYKTYVKNSVKQYFEINNKCFPCVMPGWDNSARKKSNALIFSKPSPKIYYYWLKELLENYKGFSEQENLFFINAWNEWAEGNHLEPCNKWTNELLVNTKKAFDENEDSIHNLLQ